MKGQESTEGVVAFQGCPVGDPGVEGKPGFGEDFSSSIGKMIRVSDDDIVALLQERKHLRQQVTDLQTRGGELLEENRLLKRQVRALYEKLTTVVVIHDPH